MPEFQSPRKQIQPLVGGQLTPDSVVSSVPVNSIPDQRVGSAFEMPPDLMEPPRSGPSLHQTVAGTLESPVRHGEFKPMQGGEFGAGLEESALLLIRAQGLIKRTLVSNPTPAQQQVSLPHLPGPELFLQARGHVRIKGHQHHPLGRSIETMNRIHPGIELAPKNPDHVRRSARRAVLPAAGVLGGMHLDTRGFFKNNQFRIPIEKSQFLHGVRAAE